jgi:micrococcal nuclease
VVKVFDGDTIQLDKGERVRLIGVDTPESHQNLKLERDVKKLGKSKKLILAMGRKAAAFTETLLYAQRVRLEFDVEQHDRYNRTLAYVYLEDGTFVNQKIIQQGYAYPMTIPPNIKYAHLFKQWFDEARNSNRGLWGEK